MVKSENAEAIVKAIRTGLSLEPALRRAYSYSLEAEQHKLPLRSLKYAPNLLNASRFFADTSNEGGAQFLTQLEYLALLNEEQFNRSLTPNEELAYLESYELLFCAMLPPDYQADHTFPFMSLEDILVFLRIRQWNRADYSKASFLQNLAARMVRMGIDLFQHRPERLNTFHPGNRMLTHLLAAFDQEGSKQKNEAFIAQALFNQSLSNFPKDAILEKTSDSSLYFFQRSLSQLFKQIVQASKEDTHLDIQSKNLRDGRLYLQLLFQHLGEWDDFLQKQNTSKSIKSLAQHLWEPVYPFSPNGESDFVLPPETPASLKTYILQTWWQLIQEAPAQIEKQGHFLNASLYQLFGILKEHQLDRPALFIALHEQVRFFVGSQSAPTLELSQSFLGTYQKVLNQVILLVPSNGNFRKFSNESLANVAKPIFRTLEIIEQRQGSPANLEALSNTFLSVLDCFQNHPDLPKLDFNFYTQIIDWIATSIATYPGPFYSQEGITPEDLNWSLASLMHGFLPFLSAKPLQKSMEPAAFLELLEKGTQVFLKTGDLEQADQILTFMGPCAWDLGAYSKWDNSDWLEYQKVLLELLQMQGHLKENADLFWALGKAIKQYLDPFGEQTLLQLGLKTLQTSTVQLKTYWPKPASSNVDNHLLIATLKQLQELRPNSSLRATWQNQLSEEQTLILLQDILVWIEKRPLWINNKQLQKALSAVLVVIPYDGLTDGVPFAILRKCLSGILEQVHRPSDWLLAMSIEGESKNYPLTYALQWLFQCIFNQAADVRIRLLEPSLFELMLVYLIKNNQEQGVLTMGKIDTTAWWLNAQINQFAAQEMPYEELLLHLEDRINSSEHFEKNYGI